MAASSKTTLVRAATLADVGRAAGVSAMAASTVLNGARTSARTSPETRERILKAAAELRYRPNAMARALVNRRMNTIGVAAVLHSGELNSYALEVFSGILTGSDQYEQSTTMFTLHDWGRDAARLQSWCDGRIDGLILIGPTLTREEAQLLPDHTPFVSLHSNTPLPNVLNIESDEERGAYEMVLALARLGHRRILHISGNRGLTGVERRIAGFRRGLAEVGIPFSEDQIVAASFALNSGRDEMREWLSHRVGQLMPQAVFCANDNIAFGCLEALAEVGLRVPEDISVAGFDDSLAARTTVPQLTTVRQPLRAMGCKAVELLMEQISRRDGAPKIQSEESIVYPVELITRASVAPPPAVDRIISAAA